ncbi:ArsR family transcriptional regulator [Methanomicrobium sp. W14]|uniref:ArsR/SmtB family transcription factor n=1 Tax=Methanomicrobium sp. W14 TaxID=2817839 RepID=UPI001AEA619D|nr:metalloregulator ArsR/SmtB family transcription factor [Methanomicrobium sp. W14]MBP2133956.1 ArsR family transcriptional regulator [Methanomicrobium sp. W14]
MNKKNTSFPADFLPEGVEQSLYGCGGIGGLTGRLPPDSETEALAAVYRALADSNRVKILFMLNVQPLCVCVIKTVLGIADSKLSYHLSILKKSGLISGEQKGTWIIYSLTEKGKKWLYSGINANAARKDRADGFF